MFLQLVVDGTLAAQPRKSTLGFMTQFNMRKFGRYPGFRGGTFFDFYLNKIGAGADAGVHAARGNQFGLRDGVGGKGAEEGDEVGVGEFVRFAAEKAADVAAGKSGFAGQVALIHPASFDLSLESDFEVTHSGGRRWKIED